MAYNTSPARRPKTNHLQSLGYHSLLVFAFFQGGENPATLAREAVVAAINKARCEEQLPPLAHDPLLELVGNAFCQKLLQEGRRGHFANDGVPPYLRYFLAGGRGFHRENVGSYETTGTINLANLPALAVELTHAMLSEQPPEDGHRRTLLDPLATHLGVGIAYSSHRLVISHEIARDQAQLELEEPFCRPLGPLRFSGKLSTSWRVVAVENLWQPLPATLPVPSVGSYSYPPRKAWYEPVEFLPQTLVSAPAPLSVRRNGSFRFTQRLGKDEGVELLLLWGARAGETEAHPLALGGCVVLTSPPPESLMFWRNIIPRSQP